MNRPRPTFASGHAFEGLPAIRRTLHVDQRRELYELGLPSTDGHTVLCVLRLASDRERAHDWIACQPSELLRMRRALTADECPASVLGLVVSIRGVWMPEHAAQPAPSDRLERLFAGMLELATRSRSLQLFPDFSPELTWWSAPGTLCTLQPLEGGPYSELELVREMARAFYHLVTGIDPARMRGPVPPLASWSRQAGEELSRVVDRCLAPKTSRDTIASWAALQRALPVPAAQDTAKPALGSAAAESPRGPAHGRGLSRVAGMRELKLLLEQEVVAPLRNPEPYVRYGLSIPNGILLYGPPGCGKTYIARQLAEELGHHFVEVTPSEVAGIYVHQTVLKIREVFDEAIARAPSVIFIDEFEALVPPREQLAGHQHHKGEEVNELLSRLNGCAERGVLVIAASNRPERIDAAVRRTGRLDKLIYVGPPDRDARRDMLALHLQGRPLANGFSVDGLADELVGYSASDLRCLVDEAARTALRDEQSIGLDTFRAAMTRVPASLTPAIEAHYRSIDSRGVAPNSAKRPSGIGFR